MNTAPDAVKYEGLIEQLLEVERRASTGEIDELEAGDDALLAVIGYLLTDARIVERQATRPLWRLWWAIHDRIQGARPRLLFDPRDRKGAKGAPANTSAMYLRAQVNFAFHGLLKGGMPKKEAGRWLAWELKRIGIRQPNEKEITASEVIRWGGELRGKSLKGSDEIFAFSVQRLLEKGGRLPSDTPIDRPEAQLAARVVIRMLRSAGF